MSNGLNRQDVPVKCPYYIRQTSHEAVDKISIVCESALEGSLNQRTIFASIKDKNDQLESFCQSYCWQGCPIAEMITNNKY